MEKNFDYVLKNFRNDNLTLDWLMAIENFFGKENAEEFCQYFIERNDIMRKNDIRNLISRTGFSIYTLSNNEQLAFISIFKPFHTKSKLIINMENGVNRVFKHYSDKNMKLLKDIKKLGYSCEPIKCNWKDKTLKDTYQREYVFMIFSENDTCQQFKDKITELAKKYNIEEVLITENLKDKSPKMKLKSSIITSNTREIKENIEDTTIDTIEGYLSDISETKCLFKIPYENNKTVLNEDVDYLTMKNYYSIQKQERVKNKSPYSFNSAMLKSALLHRFSQEYYNK